MANKKHQSKSSLNCVTPGCNEDVGERSITQLCKSCYAYIYNWGKKSPGDLIKRAHKLNLYESRMQFLLPPSVKLINTNESTKSTLNVMPGQVKKYRLKTKKQPYKYMRSA